MNSSMMFSIRYFLPSWVILDEVIRPDMVGRSARNRRHEPSASQSRLRLGRLAGTFSPSRRQILSTRLSLTTQPAVVRNSSAIFR